MDELILTFNKAQMKLYNKLLQSESIALSFDTELREMNEAPRESIEEAIHNIENEAARLLSLKGQGSVFSAFLTQEQIKGLIPIYYEVIRNIEKNRRIISEDTWQLSIKISEAGEACANLYRRYSDFLPYKAALYNREDYALQIDKTDRQFKESIEKAEGYKHSLLERFDREKRICECVSDFYKRSAKASDEPKFKKLDTCDFFWSVEAFLEQIRRI